MNVIESNYSKTENYPEGILYIDTDLLINQKTVLRINYEIDIDKMDNDILKKKIDSVLDKCNEINSSNDVILLLDFSKVKQKNTSLKKMRDIITHVQKHHLDKLHKCIIYNYTSTWKFFMDLLLSLLDKTTKRKVCFKNDVSFD